MSEQQLSPTATVVIAERHRRRWSQSRLAEELAAVTGDQGWKRPRVARLEGERLVIDLDTVQALSRVFDLDYATLIEGYARRSAGHAEGGGDITRERQTVVDLQERADSVPPAGADDEVADVELFAAAA